MFLLHSTTYLFAYCLKQWSLKVGKTLMSVILVETMYVVIILFTIETTTRAVLWKRVFLINDFAKFTGKHLHQCLFFLKKTLAQVFSCEFCKFSRIPILQNTFRRLLLSLNHFMLLFLFCTSWKHQLTRFWCFKSVCKRTMTWNSLIFGFAFYTFRWKKQLSITSVLL